jgi:homoserine O-acetyltransferase/O-succinyltransferase
MEACNWNTDCQYLPLGDIRLESGAVLADARLGYLTLGSLTAARDNAIVMPTYYTGTHSSYRPIIGSGHALDPSRYFIIVPNMFGNGVSSSPSNHGSPPLGRRFPRTTVRDNVIQQARLVFEHLQVAEVTLAFGCWRSGPPPQLHHITACSLRV